MATIQIDRLLETIVRLGGSDLHLVVGRPPVVRLFGSLRELQTKSLEPEDTVSLLKAITPERIQREWEETGSGDFGFAYGKEARFRVAIFKQKGFASLVLRKIPSRILTFDEIGLPEIARQICRRPRGIFLVTGPTGSGKTTTLACMINYINENFDRHIITMEDPIEYFHEHKKSIVVQREIGVDVPNFPEALRRALRANPDVILVGEMRDLETIQAAITAAETGHLVFATLHTSGAASTVNRIVDAFPTDRQEQVRVQLSGNLIAVLSQALCPRVDVQGLIAAYEFMYTTPGIQNIIRDNKAFRINSEIQMGKRFGMQSLDEHLWTLFHTGKISVEECVDKSQYPGHMMEKLHKEGVEVQNRDDALLAEVAELESSHGAPGDPEAAGRRQAPATLSNMTEAQRQAQVAANRARLAAMQQKK